MELNAEKQPELPQQQNETCSFPFESDNFSNYLCENPLFNFNEQLDNKETDKEKCIITTLTPTNTIAEDENLQSILNVQDFGNITANMLKIFDSLEQDRESGTEDNQSQDVFENLNNIS
ncbi:7317_t:CDS:2 [Ambispora leptoticha]|uniref:7317_t:CDS:1 n=1 Tax=Ambispora leptoticha TaxID=144679 RepID=A0A9N9FHK3_9GLOM|nr:7317_t:CDS:2 [Ambispora leptoticha]